METASFEEHLDSLRAHYQKGYETCHQQLSGSTLGWASSRPGITGGVADIQLRAHFDQSSKHGQLTAHAWRQETIETFLRMDCILRSIPALSHPDIHWTVAFMRLPKDSTNLPPFRMSIMGAKLTSGFVKTAKTATGKLKKIEKLLKSVPAAKPARRFEILNENWPASSPEAVARIWAALNAPDLLSSKQTSDTLPEICEIHDRLALERGLRMPSKVLL